MSRNRYRLLLIAPLLLLAAVAAPRLLARFRPLRPHAVSCAPCHYSDCPLTSDEISLGIKTKQAWYCLDYDHTPPGHCSSVTVHVFSIINVYTGAKRTCTKTNCQGTPDNSRPCFAPTLLSGGDFGNYSVSGSGASSPGSDTCKGDPTQ